MIKSIKVLALAIVLLLITIPSSTMAGIGVGVGTGKIVVDETLKPGTIYRLPPISVINTGNVEGKYSLTVTYHQDQEELRPEIEWFKFSPNEFNLKPGQIQVVELTLDLPIRTVPGKYFAYLEAFPLSNTGEDGGTSIGIAAASKIYFSVDPENMVMGIYYRALSLWNFYAPWPARVSILLGVIVVILIAKKYLNIDIKLKKSPEKKDE